MSDLPLRAAGRQAPAPDPGAIPFKRLLDAYRDPHGLYDDLRERSPVSFDPAARCWVVTGQEAVRRVLADGRV